MRIYLLFVIAIIFNCNFVFAATVSTAIFNTLYTQISGSNVDGYIITPYQPAQCVFSSTQPNLSVVGHKLLSNDKFSVDSVGAGITAWCKSEPTVVGGNFVTLTLASDAAISGNGGTLIDQSVNLSKVGGTSITLGQKTMTASLPVVFSSNQSNIPISGTVAATQSGTWTIQPGNTPNTVAWKVDGSAVTQPISATALPLPTNAATESTLSTLNGKVPANLTVSSTRLLVDGSGVTQPVSGTITANAGTGTFAVSAASLPLPTGAATEASQSTSNSSLSSIVTNTAAGVPRTIIPSTAAAAIVTNVDSTSYEASHLISNSPATLIGCSGYNSKTSTQYILFFNSTTVPSDGTSPSIAPIAVGASSSFAIDFGIYGRPFSLGIAVSNSSTANTKTIGSADVWYSCRIK